MGGDQAAGVLVQASPAPVDCLLQQLQQGAAVTGSHCVPRSCYRPRWLCCSVLPSQEMWLLATGVPVIGQEDVLGVAPYVSAAG